MANITGTNGNDLLDAVALGFRAENNIIRGNAGNDTLLGGDGNDQLIGGLDSDTMRGGNGDDRYTLDVQDLSANIIENVNEGIDTIISPVSWTLSANFENLLLIGTNPLNGTGNQLDNTITGNAASNILRGLLGNDHLKGLAGNDRLEGGSGNDNLDGGAGDDELVGGAGNDQYFVDSLNDVITENTSSGTDLVFTRVDGYTLSANVENLFLSAGTFIGTGNSTNNYIQGNGGNNTLNGGNGNDFLNGGNGNDFLNGGNGNDRLDGGSGADELNGELGNDNYFVDDVGDVVNEADAQGTDTVNSLSTTYTLQAGQSIERLILVEVYPLAPLNPPLAEEGIGNELANTIIGNTLNNILNGADGNDILNGNDGEDNLNGGADNDRLNGGADNDQLNGGDGVDDLRGNGGNDILFGDAGNDRLSGEDGNDQLTGGDGNDRLNGGAGNDTLLGNSGVNSGVDFMIGNLEADLFVIGQAGVNFYDDGDSANAGITNYALIQDFTPSQGDQIQLTGAIADYLIDPTASGGVRIRVNETTPELLAVVQNITVAEVTANLSFA